MYFVFFQYISCSLTAVGWNLGDRSEVSLHFVLLEEMALQTRRPFATIHFISPCVTTLGRLLIVGYMIELCICHDPRPSVKKNTLSSTYLSVGGDQKFLLLFTLAQATVSFLKESGLF